MILLYNFALIKNRLTFILLEIFKPVTFSFLRNQSVTRLYLCVFRPGTNNFQINGQLTMIFEISGIVSSNLINSDPVRVGIGSGKNKIGSGTIGSGKSKNKIRYKYFGSGMNKQVPVRTNPWDSLWQQINSDPVE